MAQTKSGQEAGSTRIDQIYRTLFDAILAQELLPDTKLSEVAIGDFFGVSRTMVRAAFNRLHAESLVDFRPNRGAFVASPGVEEARQIFEARSVIERDIVSKLALAITDAQLAELAGLVAQEHAAEHGPDPVLPIRLSGEFHLSMARMGGNTVLLGFLEGLITRTSLIMMSHRHRHGPDCGIEEHEAILSALRARDSARAGDAIASHLGDIFARAGLSEKKPAERDLGAVLARHMRA